MLKKWMIAFGMVSVLTLAACNIDEDDSEDDEQMEEQDSGDTEEDTDDDTEQSE